MDTARLYAHMTPTSSRTIHAMMRVCLVRVKRLNTGIKFSPKTSRKPMTWGSVLLGWHEDKGINLSPAVCGGGYFSVQDTLRTRTPSKKKPLPIFPKGVLLNLLRHSLLLDKESSTKNHPLLSESSPTHCITYVEGGGQNYLLLTLKGSHTRNK